MPQAPYTRQTGTVKIRDDADATLPLAVISTFWDVSNMRTTAGRREWAENVRKHYFAPDGREFEMVDGQPDHFVPIDDPDHVFTRIDA